MRLKNSLSRYMISVILLILSMLYNSIYKLLVFLPLSCIHLWLFISVYPVVGEKNLYKKSRKIHPQCRLWGWSHRLHIADDTRKMRFSKFLLIFFPSYLLRIRFVLDPLEIFRVLRQTVLGHYEKVFFLMIRILVDFVHADIEFFFLPTSFLL